MIASARTLFGPWVVEDPESLSVVLFEPGEPPVSIAAVVQCSPAELLSGQEPFDVGGHTLRVQLGDAPSTETVFPQLGPVGAAELAAFLNGGALRGGHAVAVNGRLLLRTDDAGRGVTALCSGDGADALGLPPVAAGNGNVLRSSRVTAEELAALLSEQAAAAGQRVAYRCHPGAPFGDMFIASLSDGDVQIHFGGALQERLGLPTLAMGH